jgi:hypothetical protein
MATFRYPTRVHDVITQLWLDVLATADAGQVNAQAAMQAAGDVGYDDTFDIPSAQWGPVLGPRVDQVLALLEDRDRAIEDFLNTLGSGGAPPIFDFPGPLVIAVFDNYVAPAKQSFTEILFGLAVSGTPTVGVLVNNVTVQTVNIPGGVNIYDATVPAVTLNRLDRLQLSIVTPGGAGGLTAMPMVH